MRSRIAVTVAIAFAALASAVLVSACGELEAEPPGPPDVRGTVEQVFEAGEQGAFNIRVESAEEPGGVTVTIDPTTEVLRGRRGESEPVENTEIAEGDTVSIWFVGDEIAQAPPNVGTAGTVLIHEDEQDSEDETG